MCQKCLHPVQFGTKGWKGHENEREELAPDDNSMMQHMNNGKSRRGKI